MIDIPKKEKQYRLFILNCAARYINQNKLTESLANIELINQFLVSPTSDFNNTIYQIVPQNTKVELELPNSSVAYTNLILIKCLKPNDEFHNKVIDQYLLLNCQNLKFSFVDQITPESVVNHTSKKYLM